MSKFINTIKALLFTTTEFEVWEWESENEQKQFRKYFQFV